MTVVFRYLAGRIIKLGNLLKGPFYVLHWIAPNLRFSIPHRAAPLVRGRSGHKIPKIIWQTNYTDRVTLAIYVNYLFNRMMSPTYEYRFMLDDGRVAFIKENYPQYLATYEKIQLGAARADLWRLLAIHKFGGAYMDIDAHTVWPLGYIIPKDVAELYMIDRNNRLTNCFFASVAGNPNLQTLIERIAQNVENPQTIRVHEITGPGVFEKILRPLPLPFVSYRITCFQGTFTNQFFQYIDHPQGKYTLTQRTIGVVKGIELPPAKKDG